MNEPHREPETKPQDDDPIVAREEAAAAREAGAIGGRRPEDSDEAERPVVEAGGGEAEGFEESERELRDEAEHGQRHNPIAEAGEPENEDAETEYGEADRLGSGSRTEEQGEDA